MEEFKEKWFIKLDGEICDFQYLKPYIDGDDWGGNNFYIRIFSKRLPQILTQNQRSKLYYELFEDLDNCGEFRWSYFESYDNMDYNGAFMEALFIDKCDEFTVDTLNEGLDWLIDGDYINCIEKCLGIEFEQSFVSLYDYLECYDKYYNIKTTFDLKEYIMDFYNYDIGSNDEQEVEDSILTVVGDLDRSGVIYNDGVYNHNLFNITKEQVEEVLQFYTI